MRNLLKTIMGAAVISAMPLVSQSPSLAFQPDAPFLVAQQRNQDKWAAADSTIDGKLAALEQKFGKKPNIIYILADDVGWGELGWQGGGKFRGTPTPTLDKLAMEGMRFWAAYAEPSCTPTRIAINTGRHPVRTGVNGVLWPGQTLGLPPEERASDQRVSANSRSSFTKARAIASRRPRGRSEKSCVARWSKTNVGFRRLSTSFLPTRA